MNFYLSAVDDLMRHPVDALPTELLDSLPTVQQIEAELSQERKEA